MKKLDDLINHLKSRFKQTHTILSYVKRYEGFKKLLSEYFEETNLPKYLPPKKLRKVANCVRGLNVNKALSSLRHMNEKGATIVEKTLSSAIANAGNTENFDKDLNDVIVKTITVDEGPAQKRFRARAQGRANRIKKRTSHLKIVIG